MTRSIRLKSGGESWYHVCVQIAGKRQAYPLSTPMCQRKLIGLLKHYTSAYCCQVAAFSVMGNHYHGILHFEAYRELNREELLQRALILYPKSKKQMNQWSTEQWNRLNERLFDLSELMRNIQSGFAKWYNTTFDRRGRFWADRFSSTMLENEQAVLDCMLYVDLNPVRAGMVSRPEEHKGTSIYLRQMGKAKWLIGLKAVLGEGSGSGQGALKEYRYLLMHRGSVSSKEHQAVIPRWVLSQEAARGYSLSGVYLKRLRYFTDGVVLGSEGYVRETLTRLREAGRYLRRKHPIQQKVGAQVSLREQRGHAVLF